MWKTSLPSETSPRMFTGSMSRALDWVPRHQYVFVGIIIITFAAVILAAFLYQRSVHGVGQKTVAATKAESSEQRRSVEPASRATLETVADSQADQKSTKTEVAVNNQQIAVPKNGSTRTTVPGNNGSSSVNVSVNSSSSGTNSSSSVISVKANSNSHTDVTVYNSE